VDLNEDGIAKPVRRRRRGADLERALLDAAWAELTERGYEAFTMDAVAGRAGTSRPVLYRRWPGKHDLVRAAIGHAGAQARPRMPDTGSLRGDLISLLEQANKTRLDIIIFLSLSLGSYYRETGTSLSELRDALAGGHRAAVEQILERAIERGEIHGARLTPRIAQLPFDLVRHQMMMTLAPVPTDAIEEIVDTIFLPLVRS
jgi:AcrR family transcriptional regulator